MDSQTEQGWPHNSCFSVGSVSVGLSGRRTKDVELVPSLEPFRIEPGESDIDVNVEWVPRLRKTVRRCLFDSGSTWQLYEDNIGLQFEVKAPALGENPYKRLLVDRYFRYATLQVSNEAFAVWPWPGQGLDYPLDELLIMHRLTLENAIEVHACGIVCKDGVGNVFVGHSGAGKSTTTRLWTSREDVEVLSDDRIIVRRKGPSLRMYGTPWHGEAMYASPNSALLSRMFVLEHGRGNVLTLLSKNQAVAELFARSFVPFHRHEYVEAVLAFLEEVAARIPVYRFAFEPTDSAVDAILNLHD